jgi:hypothetical protein
MTCIILPNCGKRPAAAAHLLDELSKDQHWVNPLDDKDASAAGRRPTARVGSARRAITSINRREVPRRVSMAEPAMTFPALGARATIFKAQNARSATELAGDFNVQTIPSGFHANRAVPPTPDATMRSTTTWPKPLWLGGPTIGPPLSFH